MTLSGNKNTNTKPPECVDIICYTSLGFRAGKPSDLWRIMSTHESRSGKLLKSGRLLKMVLNNSLKIVTEKSLQKILKQSMYCLCTKSFHQG